MPNATENADGVGATLATHQHPASTCSWNGRTIEQIDRRQSQHTDFGSRSNEKK